MKGGRARGGAAALSVLVVALGGLNGVAGKIRSVPLGRYNYFSSTCNAVGYLVLYGGILAYRLRRGLVHRRQIDFLWSRRGGYLVALVALTGALDGLGQVLSLIAQPYLPGPVISLLGQTSLIWTAIVSRLLLGTSCTLTQMGAIAVVLVGAIIPIASALAVVDASNIPLPYALLSVASSLPFALSFAVKELGFQRYREAHDGEALDVFVMNAHNSLFNLPVVLLLVPVNVAFGQTRGLSLGAYVRNGASCMLEVTPQPEDASCSWALRAQLAYTVVNLAFNISLLVLLRTTSALHSFVTLKLILPASVLLFYLPWPLLHQQAPTRAQLLSLCVVFVGVVAFNRAKRQADTDTTQKNKPA